MAELVEDDIALPLPTSLVAPVAITGTVVYGVAEPSTADASPPDPGAAPVPSAPATTAEPQPEDGATAEVAVHIAQPQRTRHGRSASGPIAGLSSHRASLERAPSHIRAGGLDFTPVAWTISVEDARPAQPGARHRAATIPTSYTATPSPTPFAAASQAAQPSTSSTGVQFSATDMLPAPSLQAWTGPRQASPQQSSPLANSPNQPTPSTPASQQEQAQISAAEEAEPGAGTGVSGADGRAAVSSTAMTVDAPVAAYVQPPSTLTHLATRDTATAATATAGAADAADAAQVAAGALVPSEPVTPLTPEGAESATAASARRATRELAYGIVSHILFLAAYGVDITTVVIMIDAGWPARFWASTLCFIIVPTGVMGLLLLVRNCWLAVCLRYFVVLLSNEARAIMLPRWYACDYIRVPLASLLVLIMALFGSLVTLYCIICFSITAVGCVPVMDFSTTITALLPFGWPRYKQRDLLLIEQYKATRYALQCLLESIPQLVVMSLALTANSEGVLGGPGPTLAQSGTRPDLLAVVLISVIVSALNVVDKLYLLGVQLRLAVTRGMRSEASMRGKWGRLVAWVRDAGQAVDDRETADDVDTGVTESDPKDDEDGAIGMWWLIGGFSATQSVARHLYDLLNFQGSHQVPPSVMESMLQHMLQSTNEFNMRSSTTLHPLPEETDTPQITNAPNTPAHTRAPNTPAHATQSAQAPNAAAATPAAAAPAAAAVVPGGAGVTVSAGAALRTPAPPAQRRRPRSYPMTAYGFTSTNYRRMRVRAEADSGPDGETDPRSYTLTLIPHFLRPPGSSRLSPAQVLTVVREAMARYPRHAITTWAVEPPPGQMCLSGIIMDGVVRFKSLQKLTICKCEVMGQGFRRVLRQLASHPSLTQLRLTDITIDAAALGALAQLVGQNTQLTCLEVSRARNHSGGATLKGMQRLTRALKSNKTLTALTLSDCGLTAPTVQTLCSSLNHRAKEGIVLTYLNVAGNRVDGGSSPVALVDLMRAMCAAPAAGAGTRGGAAWSISRVSLTTPIQHATAAGGAAATLQPALPSPASRPRFGLSLPWSSRAAATKNATLTDALVPAGADCIAVDCEAGNGTGMPHTHGVCEHQATPARVFTLVMSVSQGADAVVTALAAAQGAAAAAGDAATAPVTSGPLLKLPASLSIRTRASRASLETATPATGPAAPLLQTTDAAQERVAAVGALLSNPPSSVCSPVGALAPAGGVGAAGTELAAIPEDPPGCFAGRPRWLGGRRSVPAPPLPPLQQPLPVLPSPQAPPHTTITIFPSEPNARSSHLNSNSNAQQVPLPKLELPGGVVDTAAVSNGHSKQAGAAAANGTGGDSVAMQGVGGEASAPASGKRPPLPPRAAALMQPTTPPAASAAAAAAGGGSGSASRLGWLLPSRHRRAASDSLPSLADLNTLALQTPPQSGNDVSPHGDSPAGGGRTRSWFQNWRNQTHSGQSKAQDATHNRRGEADAVDGSGGDKALVFLSEADVQYVAALCAAPPAEPAEPQAAAQVALDAATAAYVKIQGLPVVLLASTVVGAAAAAPLAPTRGAAAAGAAAAEESGVQGLLEQLAATAAAATVAGDCPAAAALSPCSTGGLSGSARAPLSAQLAVVCDGDAELVSAVPDAALKEQLTGMLNGVNQSTSPRPFARSICLTAHRLFGSLLTSLSLNHVGLVDLDGVLVASLILQAPGLRSLSVAHNQIGDPGAKAILSSVQRAASRTPQDTVTTNNQQTATHSGAPNTPTAEAHATAAKASLHQPGLLALHGHVAPAHPLRYVDLSGNQLNDESGKALVELIRAVVGDRSAAAAAAIAAVAAADAAAAVVEACTAQLRDAQAPAAEAAAAAPPPQGHHRRGLSFNWVGATSSAAPAAAASPAVQEAEDELRQATAAAVAAHAALHAPLAALASALQRTPLTLRVCANHHPFSMGLLQDLKTAMQDAARVPENVRPLLTRDRSVKSLSAASSGVESAGAPAEGVCGGETTTASNLLSQLVSSVQLAPAVQVRLQESATSAAPAEAAKPPIAPAAPGMRSTRHSRTPSHASVFTETSDGEGLGCGVCFDNPNNLIIKDCGHKLCVACYKELVGLDATSRSAAKCPFCRGPIKGFEYRLGLAMEFPATRYITARK